VPVSLWLSWAHPTAFFVALAVALVVMIVLIWVLAKFLRQLARRVSGLLATARPSA
jgi:flagellar biogenesis protein FliO